MSRLARRKPLARRTALRSTGRIKPKPVDPLADEMLRKAAVRRQVFDRDRWTCQLEHVDGAGPCFGGLTPHHRRKAGQGGAYTLDNLVTLCAGHNDGIEADADLARLAHARGLVILRGDDADT